jgi:hypothetical protein
VALVKLPKSAQNPLTSVGIFLTTVSALLFVLLFFVDFFGLHTNPYLGMVAFLALPALFLVGLALIPVGMVRERRRLARGLGPSQWIGGRIDLNEPHHRRLVGAVGALTVVNAVIVGLAGVKGLEYMDSVPFCGTVCHTVMEPEHTAYLDGPHARVRCVECHIGPGASWFVKSKVDGIRQVWAVTFNTYARPIPSPVHDLRPARDTCEHCHWPDKFTGDVVKIFPAYNDDEVNTENSTTLQLRVGGGSWRRGGPHGIHWHTSTNHQVEYIASDDGREEIPWVRLTDATGKVTEFVKDGFDTSTLQGREIRTMDCVDCHNRPSHRFAPTPERAVDAAIHNQALPGDLPFVRREAVAALKDAYPDRPSAERAIEARLRKFYSDSYPALAADARVTQAIDGVKRIYGHNVFPAMKLTWGTHPNHLGHTDSPGCFRCHDEEHKPKDGAAISQDCETCHKM